MKTEFTRSSFEIYEPSPDKPSLYSLWDTTTWLEEAASIARELKGYVMHQGAVIMDFRGEK